MPDTYHHGDLRRTLLDLAASRVAAAGPAALSLRELAAEAGVSHAAPRHHFGSKEGLLTALATEGYQRLSDVLAAIRDAGESFEATGVGYVAFCSEHPGHVAVMFDPDLVLTDDPDLQRAQRRAFSALELGVDSLDDGADREDRAAAILAGWSLMHGLVVLHRSGALEASHVSSILGNGDLPSLARRVAPMLFGSREAQKPS